MSEQYLVERAWVGDRWHDDVLVEVEAGRFTRVEVREGSDTFVTRAHHTNLVDTPLAGDPRRLPGLVVPGFANTHSHAFHRALRGHTQVGGGTFWTWREQMYAVAARLDPERYLRLATAVYAEMVAAGYTVVGEFHYLHHDPEGRPYADPHAMGAVLVEAARRAGIRITLLDTLYLSAGAGEPPTGVQVRFADGDAGVGVDAWVRRTDAWAGRLERDGAGHARAGRALHSVRAVPVAALARVPARPGVPFHVHVSEQVAENEACLAEHGTTPTGLLAAHGLLGPDTTVVHATHLTDRDVALLGDAGVFASFCPTTERDLGDGVGPSRALRGAGARIVLGSDSHAVVDPFEEMRALELDARLISRTRGHWSAAELITAATEDGHAALGWGDAGRIEVGARADLVVLDPTTPRTAGTGHDEHTVVFAATAADVRGVMVDGTWRTGPAAARDTAGPAGLGVALEEAIMELREGP